MEEGNYCVRVFNIIEDVRNDYFTDFLEFFSFVYASLLFFKLILVNH